MTYSIGIVSAQEEGEEGDFDLGNLFGVVGTVDTGYKLVNLFGGSSSTPNPVSGSDNLGGILFDAEGNPLFSAGETGVDSGAILFDAQGNPIETGAEGGIGIGNPTGTEKGIYPPGTFEEGSEAVAGAGAGAVTDVGSSSWLSETAGVGAGYLPVFDVLLTGVQWAAIAYLAVKILGPICGLDKKQTDAASMGAAAGGFVGGAVYAAGLASGLASFGIGVLVAAIIYAVTYKDTSYKVVKFSCNAWDAEIGGDNCEKCNHQELPCSEYQCKSLGQACELLNKGTGNELCVGMDIDDPNPPTIEPWETPLTRGYDYTPDNTINPPDRGVKIINTDSSVQDKCVKAYTPLSFGVKLNKPARCRVDSIRKDNYSDMLLEISSGLKKYNHTIQLELPGVANSKQEGIEIQNDGDFELYVRCEDANGNSNLATFVFKYCVEKGPDNTAPNISETSIINNFPIAFGQESIDFTLYTNEPADCKWAYEDKSYEDMPNIMTCNADRSDESVIINSRTVYPCSTTLTGIKDRQENKFYFRCMDQPLLEGDEERESERNANTESYVHTIIGTQPLVIDEAGPNGTIIDSSSRVEVTLTAETSAGYDEGMAICSYKEVSALKFTDFFETNSYTHSTKLGLGEGDYEYLIRCFDLGGNSDTWQINFTTESDTESPKVIRAYKQDVSLKIVTDENAECVYDTTGGCSYLFDDGVPMTDNEKNHFVNWDIKKKFYIKCRDEYGNEPNPDKCSAIISPIE